MKEPSEKRRPNTTANGQTFDSRTVESVWQKAIPEPAFPGFRKDKCGALMLWEKYGKPERWGWEIDHIIPVAKGGTDVLENLQPLHWQNNRGKGNDLNWICKVRD